MIDRFLEGEDWDEPHPDMDFELTYGELIAGLEGPVSTLGGAAEGGAGYGGYEERAALARAVLVRAPALVNVALNFKICAEHGLPFHPTQYYELAEARRYRLSHPIGEIEGANRLFRDAIELARSAYRLDGDFGGRARAFAAGLPGGLPGFVYTGKRDKYTWRASEPAKVRALAGTVAAAFPVDLVVAAAHGSIMPGLLLAEYLGAPLYFLRFSMFKRNDEAPIVSLADEAWLAERADGRALLFDEDVAKGTTLTIFAERLRPRFRESRTACVIRHAGSGLRPDFAARTWWD
ncbi:MAG: hypothetical protein JNG85_15925 [Spirochaetaceae bacterium]|nr:hypothetical protein [Spirochaetaceae bacterium]